MNINAAKAVAEAVRTTLGPRGMDKMLVDSSGNVVVTNDGLTTLLKMDIDHPAANIIVEVAETQKAEVGDGTTSAVVIAGELLSRAEELIEQDIHAVTIVEGYRDAVAHAKEILEDQAIEVDVDDTEILEELAVTAMTGKGVENNRKLLANLIVDGVRAVDDDQGIDLDNIDIKSLAGGSISESQLVKGVLLNNERAHSSMPYFVENAKVAIIDAPIEVKETDIDVELNISDPDQLQEFLEHERQQLREMIDRLVKFNIDAVFVGGNINDTAEDYLAEKGIYATKRTQNSDLRMVARATGGQVVSNFDDLDENDIGYAGSIVQKELAGDEQTVIKDVEDAKSVSMVLHGGTEHVVDEVKQAVENGLHVVRAALEDGQVVPGGGALEAEIARALRAYATGVKGRKQIVVEAFADAIEVIPRTLAENAGHNPIDILVDLRNKHAIGEWTAGIASSPNQFQLPLGGATLYDIVNEHSWGKADPNHVVIEGNQIYCERILVLANIAKLGPEQIADHILLAEYNKDPVTVAGDLKGLNQQLVEQSFPEKVQDDFRRIIGIGFHLKNLRRTVWSNIQPTPNRLSNLNFEEKVSDYVEESKEKNTELGLRADYQIEWYDRKFREYQLLRQYEVTTQVDNVTDMLPGGIVEPLRVKTQAIESATEAATMILRIDDVISRGEIESGSSDDEEVSSSNFPAGGMGGML